MRRPGWRSRWPALFDGVVGQPRAVAQLTRGGPPAGARLPAARSARVGQAGRGPGLAAALLCPQGGCGDCATPAGGRWPGPTPTWWWWSAPGPSLTSTRPASIVTRAQRRPLEASRQVLVVTDVHLAGQAAPALLKTVEEPPPVTVFVLLADDLPPSLATIVSRCVKIPFDPVPEGAVVDWLVARGVDADLAATVGRASGGRLDRARLLVSDAGFVARQSQWRSVPARLDGTGAAAAAVSDELLASVGRGAGPAARAARSGAGRSGRAGRAVGGQGRSRGAEQIEDRHKREERRWRTDDLRFGLATLAGVYRDRLVAVDRSGRRPDPPPGSPGGSLRAVRQVEAIERASEALDRNANESLLMDALMVELSGMTD